MRRGPGQAPRVPFSTKNGANDCSSGLIQGERMGRYIDEILQPGERVLYSTNAHWIFFLPAIIGWIMAAVLLVLSGLVPAGPPVLICLALAAIAAIAALYKTVTAWFHRWT